MTLIEERPELNGHTHDLEEKNRHKEADKGQGKVEDRERPTRAWSGRLFGDRDGYENVMRHNGDRKLNARITEQIKVRQGASESSFDSRESSNHDESQGVDKRVGRKGRIRAA